MAAVSFRPHDSCIHFGCKFRRAAAGLSLLLMMTACQIPAGSDGPQAGKTPQAQPRFLPAPHVIDRRTSLIMPTANGWFGRLSLVADRDVASVADTMAAGLQAAGWQTVQYVRTDRILIVMQCGGRVMILSATPLEHRTRMEIDSLPAPEEAERVPACIN